MEKHSTRAILTDARPSAASTLFSVTKSIISILIGIAADRGESRASTRRCWTFFPDFPVENYNEGETTIRDITLRDLMTMTAPYKHQEEPYLEYFTRDDWVSTALELLGGPEKAGKFRYTPLYWPGYPVRHSGKGNRTIRARICGGTSLRAARYYGERQCNPGK